MSAAAQMPPLAQRPGRPPAQPPLLDVLGASWLLDAPVSGVAWDGDLACFALGDGSLAMARAEWAGAPTIQARPEGGLQLMPGSAPPPPMMRLRVHDGACLAVARDPNGGFLSGGDDGLVAHTSQDGTITRLASHEESWIDLVAGGHGLQAWSAGKVVHLAGAASATLELPSAATALGFDPAGRHVAVAHYRGVSILSADGSARRLTTAGCPRALAWSPDGRYVVAGLQENALHGWRLSDGSDIEMGGYPGQPRSLSFAADGKFLASSGAPRVACWRFDPPGSDQQPAECGAPSSRTPVCRVAYHPAHPLVAAGYGNGAVLFCRPGSDDVSFVRASSAGRPGLAPGAVPAGSAIAALSWSADGSRLAMATEAGEASLLALPPGLFRFGTRAGSRQDEAGWP